MNNVDKQEVEKFSSFASDWWNEDGAFKTLHQVNRLRLKFIQDKTSVEYKKCLDVGCGGGILTESLANLGGNMNGLDASIEAIDVAKKHALHSGLDIQYHNKMLEHFAKNSEQKFDIITCMEMLEHVPDPKSIIKTIASLVKEDGVVFLSTLNRNLKSFILSILMAERVLKMVPKGTHEYKKYLKPYEIVSTAQKYGLKAIAMQGIGYNPLTKNFKLIKNIDVNYIIAFMKV